MIDSGNSTVVPYVLAQREVVLNGKNEEKIVWTPDSLFQLKGFLVHCLYPDVMIWVGSVKIRGSKIFDYPFSLEFLSSLEFPKRSCNGLGDTIEIDFNCSEECGFLIMPQGYTLK